MNQYFRALSAQVSDLETDILSALMPASPKRRRPKSASQVRTDDWLRIKIHTFISDYRCDYLISTAIVTNFVLILLETEWTARCEDECVPLWVPSCNAALLALYTIEAFLRIYAYRKEYFQSNWDLFDLGIVIAGYMEHLPKVFGWSGVPGLAIFRIVRLSRLARAAKLIKVFPDWAAMVRGLLSAMSAMLWGFVMIFIMLLVFAVMAVELLDHRNNPWPRHWPRFWPNHSRAL